MNILVKGFLMLTMVTQTMVHAVNREIEIKFKLTDVKLAEFKQWLAHHAAYEGRQEQAEVYVDNPKQTFFFMSPKGYKDALHALRVRRTDQGDWVCFKYSNIDASGKILSKSECESKVDDSKAMLELFEKLGYTDKIDVKKVRNIYRYKDIEIVIDDVEKLGTFLEVELKRTCANDAEGIAYLQQFLKSVGITSFTQFDRSYIHMHLNPGYNFGRLVNL